MYLAGPPIIGAILKGRPALMRIAVALLVFSTIEGIMGPMNWSLTLSEVPLAPRSHTKGFHFFFNVILALGMMFAKALEDFRSFKLIPPGIGLYLVYCIVSLFSIPGSYVPEYAFMAAQKHFIVIPIGVAAYNCVRTEEDMMHVVRVMSLTCVWQALVCIKLKYVDGIHQVAGTFEHQNSLGMWGVFCGLILLAVTFGPKITPPTRSIYGYLGCAIISVATVSRATMASLAVGTALIVAVSLLRGASVRTVAMTGTLMLIAALGLAKTADTIIARFGDKNTSASGELRYVMIDAAKMMVEDRPLGIGWNNYALVVNRPYKYSKPYDEWTIGRGHNVNPNYQNAVIESHYYMLLGETGYQGLIGWLATIAAGLWMNLRAFIHFGYSRLGMLSLGIGVASLLNYGQATLERVLSQPRNLMMWLIMLAVSSRINTIRKSRGKQPDAIGGKK